MSQINFKTYKSVKIRHTLKKTHVLFLIIGNQSNANDWLEVARHYKNLGLSVYRLNNKDTEDVIEESIFSAHLKMISGPLIFAEPERTFSLNNLASLTDALDPFGAALLLKLHNSFYPFSWPKKNNLSYITVSVGKISASLDKTSKFFTKLSCCCFLSQA